MEEEIRTLQSTTLNEEWKALLDALRELATVIAAEEPTPERSGTVQLRCMASVLPKVDRLVMSCLTVDPLLRKERAPGEYELTLGYRDWWRGSSPFLLDPDGRVFHYRYAVVDVDRRPGSEEE